MSFARTGAGTGHRTGQPGEREQSLVGPGNSSVLTKCSENPKIFQALAEEVCGFAV